MSGSRLDIDYVIEQVKKHSETLVGQFIEKDGSGKGWICPYCGSGQGGKGTGLRWDKNHNRFTCFACKADGGSQHDIIDLYRKEKELEFMPALIELDKMAGVNLLQGTFESNFNAIKSSKEVASKETKEKKTTPASELKNASYYLDVASNLEHMEYAKKSLSNGDVLNYLVETRGLTNLTLDKLQELNNIGYDEKRKGVMFICNKYAGATNTRLFTPFLDGVKALKSQGVQDNYFWNLESIKANEVTFFCEGEVDALTIINHGFNAVSYGSCFAIDKLAEYLNKHYAKNSKKFFILCPDLDIHGQNSKAEFVKKYKGENYFFANIPYVDGVKDINAYHKYNAELCFSWLNKQLKKIDDVKQVIQSVKKDMSLTDIEVHNLEKNKDELQNSLLTQSSGIKLSSKFNQLNNMIGAFHVGLNIIAGESGSGKTTLAMQMLDDLAEHGAKCLMLSTEMSKVDLVARSVSRWALEQRFLTKNTPLLTNKLVRDMALGNDKLNSEKVFLSNGYFNSIKDNLYIIDGVADWSELRKSIVDFCVSSPLAEHVILIDFIQNLIFDESDETIERIRLILQDIKALAIEYNFVAFVISAVNRASTKEVNGEMQLNALRDTSNLEYLAESVLFVENGEPFAYLDKSKSKQNNQDTIVKFNHAKKYGYQYTELRENLYTTETLQAMKEKSVWENLFEMLPSVTYSKAKITIRKNRHGENNTDVTMRFYKAFSAFAEVAKDEVNDTFNYRLRTEKPTWEQKEKTECCIDDFGMFPSDLCPKDDNKKNDNSILE